MRHFIIILGLFFGLSGFSQQITRQKGRFFQNGNQITTRETKQLLSSDYQAYSAFKKGKNKESLGGFLIGLGGALVVADVVVGLVSDVNYPTAATYIGIGTLAIAIPVISGKNKKIDKGLELYNQSQSAEKKLGAAPELHIINNQRGCGLQFRF